MLKAYKFLLLSAAIFSAFVAQAGSGVYESYIVLSSNGGSNTYYDLGATTSNADFNNASLGSFCPTSPNLVIKGFEQKTFENSNDNIVGGKLFYRIYTQGSPSGSFTALDWVDGSDPYTALGGGDEKREKTNASINLLSGLSAGNYTVEVYIEALGSNGGFSFSVFASNGGANYKANFTVQATTNYYTDSDGDTFSSATATAVSSCTAIAGSVTDNSDCNDGNAAINPGATEITCNATDENCNGNGDDSPAAVNWYLDHDGDTYASQILNQGCAPFGNGWSTTMPLVGNDCDDINPLINPGATDASCDGIDQNCSGTKDENYMGVACDGSDTDLCTDGITDCVMANIVCLDNAASVVETCNNLDDDCNGTIDEGLTFTNYYTDFDGDSFGATTATAISACAPVAGKAANNTDCNDTNAAIRPNATEACNGIDDNCDGQSEVNAPCVAPMVTQPALPTIVGSTATFSWTNGCYIKYRLQYRKTLPANQAWKLKLINVPSTGTTVEGLTNGTYQWGLKAQCYSTTIWSSTASASNFVIGPAPIQMQQQSHNIQTTMLAHPNPVRDVINVNIKSETAGTCNIRLYDMMGRTVYQQNLAVAGPTLHTIQVSDLPQGQFILWVMPTEGALQQQMIQIVR